MKLITESNYNIVIEGKEDPKKSLYLTGLFSSANKKNQNGRIYPKEILMREVDKLSESISNNSCYGEAGHPIDRAETLPERIAIMVEDLSWKNDDVYGKAKVMRKTPHGSVIAGVIEENGRLGISSRGLGTVNEETNEVNEDFRLLTYDSVTSPSNYGSWVDGILEGVEFNLPDTSKQISYEDVKKVMNENKIVGDLDPLKIQEMIKEGYSAEMIVDMSKKAMEEHYKKIWQVLETI